MTELTELQKTVDTWIRKYGKRYFNELTNMVLLTEEVGELARVIVRKYGEQSSKESDLQIKMEEEISDILFVLVCIANQTGVDLQKAFEENIRKKTIRDADRHKNNKKLL